MDSYSIQSEKEKAMERYHRLRNLAKIWRLIEIVIALSLVSWSSNRLPSAARFAAGLAEKITTNFSAYAFNPLINFTIFNSIIIFLILFSRQKTESDGDGGGEGDRELVVFTEMVFEVPQCDVGEREREEEEEEEAATVENVVVKEEIDAVGVAIEAAKRQLRRFERSQSAYLRCGKARHHQLRRSETDINKERAISAINMVDERAISVIDRDNNSNSAVNERAISVIDKVDSLSSEEFQKTIDEFIARQQRFLWVQKMAEKQLADI